MLSFDAWLDDYSQHWSPGDGIWLPQLYSPLITWRFLNHTVTDEVVKFLDHARHVNWAPWQIYNDNICKHLHDHFFEQSPISKIWAKSRLHAQQVREMSINSRYCSLGFIWRCTKKIHQPTKGVQWMVEVVESFGHCNKKIITDFLSDQV